MHLACSWIASGITPSGGLVAGTSFIQSNHTWIFQSVNLSRPDSLRYLAGVVSSVFTLFYLVSDSANVVSFLN